MVPAWLNSTVTGPNFSVAAFHRRLDLRFIRNVSDEMLGYMPARADRRRGGGGRLAVAVDDRHLGAFGCEQLRAAPPIPVAPPEMMATLPASLAPMFLLPSCLTISRVRSEAMLSRDAQGGQAELGAGDKAVAYSAHGAIASLPVDRETALSKPPIYRRN